MNLVFNLEKKIGLFILTSAVIIVAILVFYDPQAPKKSLADLQKEGGTNTEGFSIEKDSQQLGIISGEDLSALLMGEKPLENLTQRFADNLAKGFVDSNPLGIQEGQEISVPDNQALLDQLAQEQGSEIDNNLFVIQKNLKITDDNSQQSILNYYENYKSIVSKYGVKMKMGDNLEMFVDTNNSDYLTLIPGYLQNMIGELKNLSVPSDFSLSHQDAINLFIMEKSIFDSLINVNDDPLKAASALMTMEELVNKFDDLDNSFVKVLKDHGFVIQY